MEVEAFRHSGFSFEGPDNLTSSALNIKLRVRKRFAFSSALKRMSVVIEGAGNTMFVFTKGAPEVLSDKLDQIPSDYARTYQFHMTRGKRVIALAYKQLPSGSLSSSRDVIREDVESKLMFLGFLIFDCDLKPDTKGVMKELIASDHKVLSIAHTLKLDYFSV